MEPHTTLKERLARAVRSATGGGRRLDAVERMRGGSKKGVYRLRLDDMTTQVAYVWDEAENYWPAADGDDDITDPFSPGLGSGLFLAAHTRLEALGVRVPRLRHVDTAAEAAGGVDRTAPGASGLVIVEDVRGETLQTLLGRDPHGAVEVMGRLRQALDAMGRHRAPAYGKVAVVEAGGRSRGTSCEAVVLDRALRDLAEAASRLPEIDQDRERLDERLRTLRGAVPPRAEYGLVHGELGSDHVLVDTDGAPVLIDLEGCMYFDAEWEHDYLRLRFDEAYRHLHAEGLDEHRLTFYRLAQALSLTAGPLRLLDGDFPDRAFMEGIAAHNAERALSFARA
ncbi:phosphotransferase [Streptomyces sp. NPDC047974]|uniref:phosphotransferase n=1 Tax=Streptomyces sp. NPDC047974 TaxID=3154343 RepID=UPI0033FC1960